MQEKEVFRFEKSGNNSKGFWVFVTLGFIALFFGGFSSIAGLVMMGYGVHLLTKKNKIIVYPTGFSILDENNSRNIAFERILVNFHVQLFLTMNCWKKISHVYLTL